MDDWTDAAYYAFADMVMTQRIQEALAKGSTVEITPIPNVGQWVRFWNKQRNWDGRPKHRGEVIGVSKQNPLIFHIRCLYCGRNEACTTHYRNIVAVGTEDAIENYRGGFRGWGEGPRSRKRVAE